MRKSRNGQRRAFAAFTKFSVLLMCFATVFALVLTAGVFDIGGSDMNANVAEAQDSAAGSTAAVTIDGGDFVQNLQETIHQSGFSSTTVTVNIPSINLSGNISAWADTSGSGTQAPYTNGDGTWGCESPQKNPDGSDGGFTMSGTHYAVLNVQVPQILKNLLAKGYTIDVTFSATISTAN